MHRGSQLASFYPDLKRHSTSPIVRQLYVCLRGAIASGVLAPGLRLPSTRSASREWRVSRGVITEAYDMLIADGFAFGRHGSGTYVSQFIAVLGNTEKPRPNDASTLTTRTISRAAEALLSSPLRYANMEQLPFVTGRGAHDERTARILKRIASRHVCFARDHYENSQGDPALRSAIATHLVVSRGVRCNAEQIFITSGAQQAVDIITRVLVTPGEAAVIEDPCYTPIRHTLTLNGIQTLNMPVDNDGIITDNLKDISRKPAAIYVTPLHQCPTGGALSPTRRQELLRFAREAGCWIIENDCDSEFWYDGRSIEALQGLEGADCVVYVGTFNSALFSNLRIGYLVAPNSLFDALSAVRPTMDRSPPSFQQRVIADFLNEGYFPEHIARLRESYRNSRDLLIEFLRERCGEFLSVTKPARGIHLTASSTGRWQDDIAFSHFAKQQGVITIPVSPMQSVGQADKLIFGFSGLSPAAADAGTRRLANVFTRYHGLRSHRGTNG
jgi:GntR family transcriptional regulator / MocR family aminotransferase